MLTRAAPPTATKRFLAGCAEAWRPRPPIDRVAWCVENIRFPIKVAGRARRFDISQRPWLREPLEALDDPDLRKMVFVGGTQLGKSLFGWAALLSQSVMQPVPAMYVGPDQDYVREQRDNIYRTAQETRGVAHRIPPERKWNDRYIDLGDNLCYLAWTGNTQRLSARSCQLIVCSEVDRWQEDPKEGASFKLVEERTKAFFRSLIIYEGTPIGDESAIWLLYEETDRRRYHVPCPRCNHFQELRFFPHREGRFAGRGGIGGLQDASGTWRKPDVLEEHVHYLCEQGCRWEESDRLPALADGVWVPEGQHVGSGGRLRGTPVNRVADAIGWQASSLLSPTVTFLRCAREYLASRDDDRAMRNFINNWCGLKYFGRRRAPKWHEVGRRLRGRHCRGVVPADALFLTCAVDVQGDYCVWRVRAWGEGRTSWGIDRGIVQQRIGTDGAPVPDSDLAALDEILGRRFPLVAPNVLGQRELKVRLLGADCQYRTLAVHNWRRGQAGDRVRTIGGDNKDFGALWRRTVVDASAKDGVTYPGGLERWGIQVASYREELEQRWHAELDQPGAWWLEEDILSDGEDYLRQLVNQRAIYEQDKAGRKKKVWKAIDNRQRYDYWACEVYNLALADMVVDSNWTGLVARYAPQQSRRAVARAEGAPREEDLGPR